MGSARDLAAKLVLAFLDVMHPPAPSWLPPWMLASPRELERAEAMRERLRRP